MQLIIGNILSFLGCILMVSTGIIKKKERVMYVQCGQFALMGMGTMVLGSVSGAVANGLSIIRNLIFARTGGTQWLKLVFIGIQLVLTIWLGDGTWVQWLPLLATVALTWAMDVKSVAVFKAAIIFGQIMWMIHDIYYRSYAAVAFDVAAVATNLYGIFAARKENQEAAQ